MFKTKIREKISTTVNQSTTSKETMLGLKKKNVKMFYSAQEYISRLVIVVVEESSHNFWFRTTQIKINVRFFRLAANPAKPSFTWICFS